MRSQPSVAPNACSASASAVRSVLVSSKRARSTVPPEPRSPASTLAPPAPAALRWRSAQPSSPTCARQPSYPSRELLVQREMPRATSNQTRLPPFCHAQNMRLWTRTSLIVQLLCVVVSKKFERKVRYSDLCEPIARCSLTHLLQIGYIFNEDVGAGQSRPDERSKKEQ